MSTHEKLTHQSHPSIIWLDCFWQQREWLGDQIVDVILISMID
jgi:hypothetical protein